MNEDFISEIKENTEFQVSDEIAIKYDQKEPEYAVLEDKNHISEITGKSDLEKALNLLGKVDNIDDVKNYYTKNLFFLRCKAVQGYGKHREYGNMLEIAPVSFDVHKRMVENIQFRIKTYGDFEIFRIWLAYEEKLQNRYIDIESIYYSP